MGCDGDQDDLRVAFLSENQENRDIVTVKQIMVLMQEKIQVFVL